jgi:subfamily B ATP-binding cassette protein MsbA
VTQHHVRPDSGRPYRRLLGYSWPYRGVFLIAVLGMVGLASTDAAFAALMRDVLDGGFVARDQEFIRKIPWLIVGLFFIRGTAGFLGTYCMRWVGRRVIFDIRQQMFGGLIHLPTSYYDAHASATLVSKLIYDVEQVADAATNAVTTIVKDGATVLALLGWLLWLNWKLTITFFLLAPFLALFVKLISNRLRTVSRNIQASVGGIADVAKEAIQGHRVVKAFGGHEYESRNFHKANNKNRGQAMKKATVAAASVPVMELMGAIALSLIIYLATQPVAGDMITVGTFVSYMTALLLLMGPARRLTKVNEPVQTGLAAAQSVFAVIDEPREEDRGEQHLGRARGLIEYEHVEFHYGSAHKGVLHDISFRIEPGQTVALVGASGSGKSSIAGLLPRFYQVEQGAIRIDGININDVRLHELRKNISIVTQETTLFNDTIRNNITYGCPDRSEQAVRDAATAAHVLEFAEQMADGLETVVGEHGVLLSGGQRQRIAIARALYKDAPILILDEATSSLDSESERQVQDAINNLISNRTTLVIAHRLSTIEHADRILVIKHGRIVESGAHRELLGADGVYARLYQTQFAQHG